MPQGEYNYSVLIVDDEELVCLQYARICRRILPLVEVYSCLNSYSALEHIITHENIGILVVDYNMPGVNGDEFIKLLARFAPRPFAVIRVTGWGSGTEEFLKACTAAGNHVLAIDYLEKPHSLADFAASVIQCTERLAEYISVHNREE